MDSDVSWNPFIEASQWKIFYSVVVRKKKKRETCVFSIGWRDRKSRKKERPSANKYSRQAFKSVKSQASRASASVVKTRGLRAIGHGMLSGRWISTPREREEAQREEGKREGSRLFSIEIRNRRSLLPFAAHYRCRSNARRISSSILPRSVKRRSKEEGGTMDQRE